ncbi:hypothetical protein OV090_06660 [Nannocystis sp. RBIL2]|uniref:hypothetical protein n=1 Tax=Nannocystis sp. RBIL2 TaxID=2996788 RepID=UPI002270EB96|nr:hypothetical protein [Nannocystis sp. RBIL2]MCY1064433.1 hypothetical protein [Nannocystis sp. RBIL2]
MLSLVTRRLTASERAEFEAERARLVVAHVREEENFRRATHGGARSMLWIVGLFAALAAFNVHTGHLGAAAAAGVGAAEFLGIAAWLRFRSTSTSVLDVPAVVRLDEVLARDEVVVLEIRADAAVTVHAVDGDDAPKLVGDLLRTAADQVVYLSRAMCPDVDAERLPNAHVRITYSPTLGIRRVELLGERITPLAALNDATNEGLWRDEDAIVWTPGEEHCELLDLDKARLFPIVASVRVEELAAALVNCASR